MLAYSNLDEAGEWQHLEAARFKHLHLPCPLLFSFCVCVLDAPPYFEATGPFAAILVPRGHELDWVFSTSNGLWDLLFSAAVSRLVVFRRLSKQHEEEEEEEQHRQLPPRDQERYSPEIWANLQGNECIDDVDVVNKEKEQEEEQYQCPQAQGDLFTHTRLLRRAKNHATHCSNEQEIDRHQHAEAYCASGDHQLNPFQTDIATLDNDSDDTSFKSYIRPLLHFLFPWSIYPGGPAPDAYVTYEDHVQIRLILEKRYAEALGGGVLVEDVELDCSLDDGTSAVDSKKHKPILRRRMRFQQMPNLIQTEVPLAIYKNGQLSSVHGLKDVKAAREKLASNNGLLQKEGLSETREIGVVSHEGEFEVRLDHSKLVHKYLPPIVAGLVLASPCLNACMAANMRARVLAIGLGGGALPVFLHKAFGFSVVAVDTEQIVVDLARRHFGLVESEYLHVEVMDGKDVVVSIAHQACNNGFVPVEMLEDLGAVFEASACELCRREIFSAIGCFDPRMHVIVVDVNAADAHSGLLSPPLCFLSEAFLLAVRMALHEGGMLVINVIPRAQHNLKEVVGLLCKVFSGIYRIQIEDNHVLFVFPLKIADIDMGSDFALRVARSIGDDLFDKIEEIN